MGATDIAINMKKKLNKERGCILLYSEVFLHVYGNIRMAFNKPLISLMSTTWPANISGKRRNTFMNTKTSWISRD